MTDVRVARAGYRALGRTTNSLSSAQMVTSRASEPEEGTNVPTAR
jgi:hypothetical protein